MPASVKQPRFSIGDTVRMKSGSQLSGTVVEVRVFHAGDGRVLYRVRAAMAPDPVMIEAREDELEQA